MRICIVAEGCYPYVVGGVSSWIHSMINSFPNTEFIVLAIVANRSIRGKFVYDIPENVTEIYELYLEDYDWSKKKSKVRLNSTEYQALRSLILDRHVDWETLFELFAKDDISIDRIVMGEDFLQAVKDCYNLKYSQVVFSDFLWTMRSIYLPLFLYVKHESSESGFVSLRCNGICRNTWQYGEIFSWKPCAFVGAWNIYERA